jgi:hypothetical protein
MHVEDRGKAGSVVYPTHSDDEGHDYRLADAFGTRSLHAGDGRIWRHACADPFRLARGEVPVMLALRLFLPESWTSKRARLERAGVPTEYRTARTKLEMAFGEDRSRHGGWCALWLRVGGCRLWAERAVPPWGSQLANLPGQSVSRGTSNPSSTLRAGRRGISH